MADEDWSTAYGTNLPDALEPEPDQPVGYADEPELWADELSRATDMLAHEKLVGRGCAAKQTGGASRRVARTGEDVDPGGEVSGITNLT